MRVGLGLVVELELELVLLESSSSRKRNQLFHASQGATAEEMTQSRLITVSGISYFLL